MLGLIVEIVSPILHQNENAILMGSFMERSYPDVDTDLATVIWTSILARALLSKAERCGIPGSQHTFQVFCVVCHPNLIKLPMRLTSTLTYAKGLPSLRPLRLHLSASYSTEPPRGSSTMRSKAFISLHPPSHCQDPQAGTFIRKH